MLTEDDTNRLDEMMARILKVREDRGFDVPDRNEERIAEILSNAERRAYEEHIRLLEEKQQFASAIRFQESASDSEEMKDFPEFDDYRNFSFE